MDKLFPNVINYWPNEFLQASLETVQMTVITMLIAGFIGLLLGLVLLLANKDGLRPNRLVYSFLDKLVDLGRAIPFIILLVAIMPFTRFIVGTSIGTAAVTVPIIVGTIPFYARMVENSLLEVDAGIIEAAQAMGMGTLAIVFRVYLREGRISILRASNFTIISVIGLTAMAGVVGGGGLGNMAVQYGYARGAADVTLVALILTLLFVFITQLIGNLVIRLLLRGRKI